MHRLLKVISATAVCLSLIVGPQSASADVDLEGDVAILSDYVYRGLSRSGGDPVLQGTLDVILDDNFYVGGFMSTLSNGVFGRDIEAEAHAGYTFSASVVGFSLGAKYDTFHDGSGTNDYFEFSGSVGADVGLIYATAGLAFSPDGREVGGGSSRYGYVAAELPLIFTGIPGLVASAKLGYEDFEFGFDKVDWALGLFVSVAFLELGAQYTDTTGDLATVPGKGGRVLFFGRAYF